jgi:hypothetical protein
MSTAGEFKSLMRNYNSILNFNNALLGRTTSEICSSVNLKPDLILMLLIYMKTKRTKTKKRHRSQILFANIRQHPIQMHSLMSIIDNKNGT